MTASGLQRPSLRVTKVAALLEVDISTVYKLVKSGALEAHRIGKRGIRIYADSLREYQENERIIPNNANIDAIKPRTYMPWQNPAYREAEAYLRSMGCL
jgi:excisionase family DNA binding protein